MNILKSLIGPIIDFNPLHWLQDTQRMKALIKRWRFNHSSKGHTNRIGVIVTPWVGTDVPWFSLAMSLLLSRSGSEVVVLLDDLTFGDSTFRFRFTSACIASVLNIVSTHIKVIRLSRYVSRNKSIPEDVRRVISSYASYNAIWALRGEMIRDGREDYIRRISEQLSKAYNAIHRLLSEIKLSCLFIPGGIYGNSGLWNYCAGLNNIRIASYDGGLYGMLIGVDGVAAKLPDIPKAFHMIKILPEFSQTQDFIKKAAMLEMNKRRDGSHKFASQVIPKTDIQISNNKSVLLALNSSWDAAALGSHIVFDSSMAWVIETTRWILNNSDYHVMIRQHPIERLSMLQTTENYPRLISDHFGNTNRITFISAEDPVNTYDLIENVSAIIVHTSTIAVEAAALGKIAITSSRSYYSKLGFVYFGNSREEYFLHLSNALAGKYVPTKETVDDALLCYYLTQCCNWIFSPFKPGNFHNWQKMGLEKLRHYENIQLMMRSIQEATPVAYFNHFINLRGAKYSA